ncbi:MAG: redoxin domain-containing protein [Bacteroidota bacterium]
MRVTILFFLCTLSIAATKVSPDLAIKNAPTQPIKIYIFLLEDCVISQYYTLQLRELHEKYASEKIEFIGVFPNRFSSPETIKQFKKDYQIPFELKYDHYQTLTKKMGATVTPEVVVYDEEKEAILYKGRIDNTYFRVGKRRQVTTTSELSDILEALQNNTVPSTESTVAIGCYIKFEGN